jgi:serine/threonine-protein kinase
MSSIGQVTALLQRWEELRGKGQTPSVKDLCADCPEHEQEVALRIRVLEARFPQSGTTAAEGATGGGEPKSEEEPWPEVPGYEILCPLGQGGMGIVFKATHLALKRTVALKMILMEERGSSERLTRLRREAEAIARLKHPNIVEIYDFAEHGGRPYLSMEFVAGGDLRSRLDGTPWPEREAAALIEQVARAVHAAHERGIVHRDLKPGNVLLQRKSEIPNPKSEQEERHGGSDLGFRISDFTPKVADFGLAKYLDGAVTQTQTGVLLGTPGYMAPEQAAGQNDQITPSTDTWALGIILYELLTGRRPFAKGSWPEVCQQVLSVRPPRPGQLRPGLDPALEAIVQKCLEKEPKARFATAGELAEELGRWLRGEPTQTYPLGWRASTRRFVRRHALACMAAVALSVSAAVAAFLFVYLDPDRELKAIQRDLAKGQKVTLIGETGAPRWYKIREGEKAAQVSIGPDELFTVNALSFCLVELVHDPQSDHFLFRAEVMHTKATHNSEVGIYVAHRVHSVGRNAAHSFLTFAYDDVTEADARHARVAGKVPPNLLPPPPKDRAFWLFGQLHAARDGEYVSGDRLSNWSVKRFVPAGLKGGGWHLLELQVTPESVQAFWDHEPIGTCAWGDLDQQARDALESRKRNALGDLSEEEWRPEFLARGALGLYALNGSVKFKNVAVEPFPRSDK